MASSADAVDGGTTVVEVNDEASADEISPLLVEVADKPPEMTIFSVSYSRKRPPTKEPIKGAIEGEVSSLSQIVMWVWDGSRYSGLLCAGSSSTIYFIMEVLAVIFQVRSIPLFETVLTRCTIVLFLSFLWLRRTGQPLCAPTHIRKLLVLRSLFGYISMLCFVYSVQNLPLSLAVTLNFATPIVAAIVAKVILREKFSLSSIGGLACSFLGLLFIIRPMLIARGDITKAGEMSNTGSVKGSDPVIAILVGIFSSVLGGISYCLVRAGAKASDHPVYTVFSYGLLASPVSGIFAFTLQEFVLPKILTFFLMVLLGVLAFFAEISFARGLQLEKIGKITNILYIKVLLTEMWSIAFLGVAASLSKLFGCLLILASVCCTMYLGPDND